MDVTVNAAGQEQQPEKGGRDCGGNDKQEGNKTKLKGINPD